MLVNTMDVPKSPSSRLLASILRIAAVVALNSADAGSLAMPWLSVQESASEETVGWMSWSSNITELPLELWVPRGT